MVKNFPKLKTLAHGIAFSSLTFFLSIFILLKSWQAFEQLKYVGLDKDQGIITVTASAKYSNIPQRAKVSVYLQTTAKTSIASKLALKKQEQKLLTTCKSLNIPEKNINSQGIHVSEYYEWQDGKREKKGYRASESIIITLDNVNQAKNLVNQLAVFGFANVDYQTYSEAEDVAKLKDQAIQEAIQKAKAKAKNLAESLGVHLGKLVEYSEGPSYEHPMPVRALAVEKKDNDLDIPTGENTHTVTVTLKYKVW